MRRTIIMNEDGEPMGYEEHPTQYEQDADMMDQLYNDPRADMPRLIQCPNPRCMCKLDAEDCEPWDGGIICPYCKTQIEC